MAVPCQGAKIIFEAILNCFAGIEYESIEPNIKGLGAKSPVFRHGGAYIYSSPLI